MICRRRRLCKYSPAGTNFYKVLQEGKSCYKIVGAFSMVPHRASGHETIWTAEFNNVPPIIIPIGALIYRYNKKDDSWVKTRHVKAPPKNFFTSPLRRSKRLKRPEDKKHWPPSLVLQQIDRSFIPARQSHDKKISFVLLVGNSVTVWDRLHCLCQ